jgi:hypothetical protein
MVRDSGQIVEEIDFGVSNQVNRIINSGNRASKKSSNDFSCHSSRWSLSSRIQLEKRCQLIRDQPLKPLTRHQAVHLHLHLHIHTSLTSPPLLLLFSGRSPHYAQKAC